MSLRSRNEVLLALMTIGIIAGGVNAKPPSRISGGTGDASPGEYPWVVGIFSDEVTDTLCGGAIIGPRHILTAAHCLQDNPTNFRVRSGSIHANSDDVLVSYVSRYIIHPEYKERIQGVTIGGSDIAILVLEKDLPLDEQTSIVSLPEEQVTTQYGFFAGWGIVSTYPVNEPTTLQTAGINIVDDRECANRHGKPGRPHFICGYQPNGYILDGDSGSPLISAGKIVGVASATFDHAGVPDHFSNVYHYVNWIKSVVAST